MFHSLPSVASLAGSSSGIGGGGVKGEVLGPNRNNNASAVVSPIRGTVGHSPTAGVSSGLPQAKKRNVSVAGIDSSPGSTDDIEDHDGQEDKRRQPVKRACNECRQQKVSAEWIWLSLDGIVWMQRKSI